MILQDHIRVLSRVQIEPLSQRPLDEIAVAAAALDGHRRGGFDPAAGRVKAVVEDYQRAFMAQAVGISIHILIHAALWREEVV